MNRYFPRFFSRLFLLTVCCFILAHHSYAERQNIRVGIDLWPGYYPVLLAKHLGFFDRRNLDVDIILPEDTDNMLQDFTHGKLDLICVAMGDVFSLKKDDPDLRVVMITDESSGGDALIGNRADLAQLKGKRIGTNLNGFGELFIRAFLQQSGMHIEDVTLVHQEAAQAINYLRDNKADIVHTWEPYVTEAISFHYGEIVFDSSQTPGLIPDSLIANGHTIKHKESALTNFISAWLEAVEWWLTHRSKGDSIIELELLLMPGSVNLDGVRLYTKTDNQKAYKKTNNMSSIHHVADQYIKFFETKGVLKANLTSEDFVTGRFLPE